MTITLPQPRFTGLRDLRVAVWAEQPGSGDGPETTARLLDLADALERQGVTVSRSARPDFDATEAYHLYLRLLDAAWSGRTPEEAIVRRRRHAATLSPSANSADDIMVRMVDVTHRTWLGLNEKRFQWRRVWSAFFREWDVLLCPVIATAALPHRQDGGTWERRMEHRRPGDRLQ